MFATQCRTGKQLLYRLEKTATQFRFVLSHIPGLAVPGMEGAALMD
jgi:hypothetical protein